MKKMKSKSAGFLIVSMAVLVLITVLMSGIVSDWWNVKVQRVHFPAENGKIVSAIFYIPSEASNENPVPAVLNFHGRGDNAHSVESYAMEQARRGYVGIVVDWDGGGQSEELESAEGYAIAATDFVKDMPFIDGGRLSVTGWSAGNKVMKSISELYPDNYQTIISVFAPMIPIINGECNANLMILKSSGDQYNYALTGTLEEVEAVVAEKFHVDKVVSGEVIGSFEDKTAREYVYVDHSIHQDANINKTVIANMLEFLDRSVPAPKALSYDDQIWKYVNILSLFGYIAIFCALASFACVLLEIPYFAVICNPLPKNRGRKGKKLYLNIIANLVFLTIAFIPLSYIGINILTESRIFPSRTLNSFLIYLLLSGLFSIVMIGFEIRGRKKAGETVQLSDYAIAGEGETKIPWTKAGRAFLIGVITAFAGFSWVHIAEHYFGVSYNFRSIFAHAIFMELTPYRFVKAIPYALILFVIMFSTTILMNTSNRIPDSGNPKKDMVLSMVINGILGAVPLLILLIIQYGGCELLNTGQTVFPQFNNVGGNTSTGGLDFAASFPIMMFVGNSMVTFFYRKTGNHWVGSCIMGILMAFMSITTCAMML